MNLFKSVAITGANRGLGLELVNQLASRISCETILATCRDPAQAGDLQQLAKRHSNKILVKPLDVNCIEEFEDFIGDLKTKESIHNITCLINNAGVSPRPGKYQSLTLAQMESTLRTNLIAPLFLSRAFLPMLKQDGGGLIVNISSILGSIENNVSIMGDGVGNPGGGRYPYRASKAGLNMITRSLSVDLETFNIGAIAVHPGWVKTAMGGPRGQLTPEQCVWDFKCY